MEDRGAVVDGRGGVVAGGVDVGDAGRERTEVGDAQRVEGVHVGGVRHEKVAVKVDWSYTR